MRIPLQGLFSRHIRHKKRLNLILLFLLILTCSCKPPLPDLFRCACPGRGSTFHFEAERTPGPPASPTVWQLNVESWSGKGRRKWFPRRMPFQPFKLDCGDLDGDQRPEVLVGVIKESPFDSVIRKRPFLYQLKDGQIKPLWHGSRLVHPLQNVFLLPKQTRSEEDPKSQAPSPDGLPTDDSALPPNLSRHSSQYNNFPPSTYIHHLFSIEYEENGLFLVAEYGMGPFNPELIRYWGRQLSLPQALRLLPR